MMALAKELLKGLSLELAVTEMLAAVILVSPSKIIVSLVFIHQKSHNPELREEEQYCSSYW